MRWILAVTLFLGCGDDDGAADSGGTDGGRLDAALDSGSGDVGSEDVGGEDSPAPDTGPPDEMVFMEVDGLVAFEAEHFSAKLTDGLPRDWYLTTASMTPDVTQDPVV